MCVCVCVCVCAKREQIGRAGGGGYLCLGEEELLAANEVRRYEFLLFLRRRKGSWSTSREILPALSGKDLAPAAAAVATNAASSSGGTAARIPMAGSRHVRTSTARQDAATAWRAQLATRSELGNAASPRALPRAQAAGVWMTAAARPNSSVEAFCLS